MAAAAAPSDAAKPAPTKSVLDNIAPVIVDKSGTFKYVAIELEGSDGSERTIVRGHEWAHYHANVFTHYKDEMRPGAGRPVRRMTCPGGGRIRIDAAAKTITIYGYSVDYGRADHELTASMVTDWAQSVPELEGFGVEWTNEGY